MNELITTYPDSLSRNCEKSATSKTQTNKTTNQRVACNLSAMNYGINASVKEDMSDLFISYLSAIFFFLNIN